MWQDVREVRVADLAVQIPGPTEMLIHLAVHSACHGNIQLRWLYDIKRWLERFGDQIDPTLKAKIERSAPLTP
jgi:hypothetical protein